MTQDFPERKPLANQHKQTETFCPRRGQLPANTAARSQSKLQRRIVDSHLSESPNHASLPEPVRDTRQNIAKHRTYTDSALSLPATLAISSAGVCDAHPRLRQACFPGSECAHILVSGPNLKGPTTQGV
jgi:hypothetical protein